MSASRPAPSSAVRATLALAAMELRLTLRRGENLLVTIVIPAVVLLFFASVGVLQPVAGRPVDFLLPGSISLAVIATSLVSLGIATGYERSYGVLKRLGGSPLPRAGLVAAKILSVLVVEAVQVLLLTTLAVVLLDWRLPAGANLPVLVAAILLGSLTFGGLGLLMAGRLRAEATLALANGLFLAFLLLGGIIIPIDRLPAGVAAFAQVLPASPLAEALRIALAAPGATADPLGPLSALLAWGVVSAGLASITFRWD
jgi:ABC-2 type transport system permease protein